MKNNNMLPDVGRRGDSAALASRIIWAGEGMIGLHVRAESPTAFGPQLWSSESASVPHALVPGSWFCTPTFNVQQPVGDLGVPVATSLLL